MPIVELSSLKSHLGPKQRLLGLDLGSKTIGLAVSDPSLIIASPLETIRRTKFTADARCLTDLHKQQQIGGWVLGLPLEMDGQEGPRCQSTRQFAQNFMAISNIPIAYWDERLSSSAVNRFLVSEADMTRKRRGQVVDKMAAAYILQGALDAIGLPGR
ncbi:MAG: Holliday junction resolvase RuvX [Rhodospirillales bacterium]|nr:Holliday junction resolvase RuvX [Rhodospirillales bacterium]